MKKIVLLLIFFCGSLLYSQQKKENYFSFYKGGKKYAKPIKYILFNPEIDKRKEAESKIFFYMKGQRFVFKKNKSLIDTCSIKHFSKKRFSDPSSLEKEVTSYYKEKHMLKYPVSWESQHSYK